MGMISLDIFQVFILYKSNKRRLERLKKGGKVARSLQQIVSLVKSIISMFVNL